MNDLSPAAVEAAARAVNAEINLTAFVPYEVAEAAARAALAAAARAGDDATADHALNAVCLVDGCVAHGIATTPVPSSADDPRAEVERLRGRLDRRGWTVSRLQDSRDQALARAGAAERQVERLTAQNRRLVAGRNTARQEVADLRAGIAAKIDQAHDDLLVTDGEPHAACWNEALFAMTQRLRAVLAGSGEQPGEDYDREARQRAYDEGRWCGECRFGVVEDPPCCTPAPVAPDSPDLREQVARVLAVQDGMSYAGVLSDSAPALEKYRARADAVLAAMGQGVTAKSADDPRAEAEHDEARAALARVEALADNDTQQVWTSDLDRAGVVRVTDLRAALHPTTTTTREDQS